MKFKIWDFLHKRWSQDCNHCLGRSGELLYYSQKNGMFLKSPSSLKPIFSTGKTDKNGVELFDGDEVRDYKTKGVIVVEGPLSNIDYGSTHNLLTDLTKFEKIGSKYEQ